MLKKRRNGKTVPERWAMRWIIRGEIALIALDLKNVLSVVHCIVYINLMYVLRAIDEPEDLFKNVLQIVLSFCLLTL